MVSLISWGDHSWYIDVGSIALLFFFCCNRYRVKTYRCALQQDNFKLALLLLGIIQIWRNSQDAAPPHPPHGIGCIIISRPSSVATATEVFFCDWLSWLNHWKLKHAPRWIAFQRETKERCVMVGGLSSPLPSQLLRPEYNAAQERLNEEHYSSRSTGKWGKT